MWIIFFLPIFLSTHKFLLNYQLFLPLETFSFFLFLSKTRKIISIINLLKFLQVNELLFSIPNILNINLNTPPPPSVPKL